MITSESKETSGSQTVSTLLICIDAFSHTYLTKENTPFMYEMANRGIGGTLKPLFAFRGIETTMFTGVWPDVHGTWTEISMRQSETKSYNNIGGMMVRLLDLIPSDKARKIGRVVIQRLLDNASVRLTPNLIPPEAFGFFEPAQKKAIFEAGCVNSIPTVFDLLRQQDVDFAFIEPPIIGGDKGVVAKVEKIIKSKSKRKALWYLKFGKLDKEGHNYGPSPLHFQLTLREIDRYVQDVVGLLKSKYSELNVMIMADHGMSSVADYYDIFHELKGLKSVPYRDYIPFFDSTMARFWFLNDVAKDEVRDYLDGLKYGHVISSQEMQMLHVPDQRRYGDLVFVVDEGKMIYPDFWSGTRKAKGMHGYAFPSSDEALPAMIANKEMSRYCRNDSNMTYVDVFSLINESLWKQ